MWCMLMGHNHGEHNQHQAAGPVVASRTCPQCGYLVQEDFNLCPNCGTALKTACPACHRAVQVAWRLCPYCGADLKAGVSTPEVVAHHH